MTFHQSPFDQPQSPPRIVPMDRDADPEWWGWVRAIVLTAGLFGVAFHAGWL